MSVLTRSMYPTVTCRGWHTQWQGRVGFQEKGVHPLFAWHVTAHGTRQRLVDLTFQRCRLVLTSASLTTWRSNLKIPAEKPGSK